MTELPWANSEGATGDCKECGGPLLWGGISWVEHTAEYHRGVRRRLKDAARWVFLTRIAVKAGHKGTIRFTATHAWFACSCGARSHTHTASAMARYEGQKHLYGEGVRQLMDALYGPTDGHECRYCGHRWHGLLLCGDMFDWATCRCRGSEKTR